MAVRRRKVAPPSLPGRTPWPHERVLAEAIPYLVVVFVLSATAALALQKLGHADLVFSLPRGKWALGPRRLLHWVVFPLLVVGLAVWAGLVRRKQALPSFRFSRVSDLAALGPGLAGRLVDLPRALRVSALCLWLFALMGPEVRSRHLAEEARRGIDIMVALDVSQSMESDDMPPSRLEVAKRVLDEFVQRRKNDRIGLVVFGREAYAYCPLTVDHAALRAMLASIEIGVVDPRGTAIGDAIGTALNRLRKVDKGRKTKRSKVVILLTDGANNAGILMPRKAAEFARTLGVRIYTILVGYSDRQRPSFAFRRYPVDPKLLEEIAATTGGTPYTAADVGALRNRFQRILDSLQKDVLPARYVESRRPVQQWFVTAGLLVLMLELLLSLTVLRRYP